jgi:hypothetical protein
MQSIRSSRGLQAWRNRGKLGGVINVDQRNTGLASHCRIPSHTAKYPASVTSMQACKINYWACLNLHNVSFSDMRWTAWRVWITWKKCWKMHLIVGSITSIFHSRGRWCCVLECCVCVCAMMCVCRTGTCVSAGILPHFYVVIVYRNFLFTKCLQTATKDK